MSTWTEIERKAREQADVALDAVEAMPLTVGCKVAWAECDYGGKTDGLSEVHRVAVALGLKPETYCGERIPDAVCRLDLRVWPEVLRHCKWCAIAYAETRGRSA